MVCGARPRRGLGSDRVSNGRPQTLNTGSLAWAIALCGAYFYMALSWGGYTFIINLLPIYCLVSVFSGRLTSRLYVAFAPIVAIGTLLAASIPVIGFNAVTTSEHFGAFLAFAVLHGAIAVTYIQRLLPPREFRAAAAAFVAIGAVAGAAIAFVVVLKMLASPTFGWTGRSLSLLDPTYAARYIPIIASVSEHQPPSWNSYFMDIQAMVVLMPVGFILCFLPLTDGSLFLVLYGVTAVYFSGVMVRLMLVLAPAACCLAAIGADAVFRAASRGIYAKPGQQADEPPANPTSKCGPANASRVQRLRSSH
jgi:dolichyl-diphosphooligosaccharide---protein glycosyltransferase